MFSLAFERSFQRMKVCPSSTPFAKFIKPQNFIGRRSKTNTDLTGCYGGRHSLNQYALRMQDLGCRFGLDFQCRTP